MAAPQPILVLGGTGQLGTALADCLTSRGEPFRAPGRAEIDLARADAETAIERMAPRAVIHAAAYNDVNGAENEANRAEARRINAETPGRLAFTCARRGIPLIHVSTDYVFDGRLRRPYREDDPPSPLQRYGRTKLAGERAVLEAYPGALVVRTSTIFGRDRRGGSNYVAAILSRARSAGSLELVRLPESSPTYAADLAGALLDLLDGGASGIVHVANAGGCTRYELALLALRLAGIEDRVEVRERPAAAGGAERPDYSVLDTSRFARLSGRAMRSWQDALGDYVGGF